MNTPDTFDLQHVDADGVSTYAAPHELNNEVRITFPAGYFGERWHQHAPETVAVVLHVSIPEPEPVWTWGGDTAPTKDAMERSIQNYFDNELTTRDLSFVESPNGDAYVMEISVKLVPVVGR